MFQKQKQIKLNAMKFNSIEIIIDLILKIMIICDE